MKRILLWLIPGAALWVAAVVYFWPASKPPRPNSVATPTPPPPKPEIRYPVESDKPPPESLPPLGESDGVLADALAALLGDNLAEVSLCAGYCPPSRSDRG